MSGVIAASLRPAAMLSRESNHHRPRFVAGRTGWAISSTAAWQRRLSGGGVSIGYAKNRVVPRLETRCLLGAHLLAIKERQETEAPIRPRKHSANRVSHSLKRSVGALSRRITEGSRIREAKRP